MKKKYIVEVSYKINSLVDLPVVADDEKEAADKAMEFIKKQFSGTTGVLVFGDVKAKEVTYDKT